MLNKMHLSLSNNMKFGLLFFFSFILCCVIYVKLILPISNDRVTMANKLTMANTRLAALQTFAGQNQDYDSLLKIQNMKVAAAKKKIPDIVAVPELVGEYNKIAEQAKVNLISVKPDKGIKEKNYFKLPITVTIEGDYFRLITFLQQVDNGDRFVTLESTKFSSSKAGNNLTMDARFVVYCLQNIIGAPTSKTTSKSGAATGAVDAKKSIQQRDAQTRKAMQ